jgi:glycosyltransferase involved in cell wall biosynthesis
MKILFYCTYPTQSNGYARIGNNITNYLVSNHQEIELYYFGITKSEQTFVDRFIHPRIKLINVIEKSPNKNEYGDDIIVETIQNINPDVIFLYNDILVLTRMINQINQIPKTFKIFTYIDLVYPFENHELINFISQSTDKFFVFSDYWREHLLRDYSIGFNKVFTLRHGLDISRIFPMEKLKARSYFGFHPDDLVFLNLNRNTHRKAIDITIRSFLELVKRHPDKMNQMKLFLNGLEEPSSYPNLKIIEMECKKLNLDFSFVSNQLILVNKNIISDFELNILYNACDVGINTCMGEGFGLCNLEHASVGKPQIITNVGGLKDIFDEEHAKLIQPSVEIFAPKALETTGGYLSIGSVKDFTDAMEFYFFNKEKGEQDGLYYKNLIPILYDWNIILKEFYEKHLSSINK